MAKKKGNALATSAGAGEMGIKPIHDDPIDNHEVKGHLNTLLDAHAIQNDPEKMKKVHALAGRHAGAIAGILSKPAPTIAPKVKSIDDIKNAYAKIVAPKSPDGNNDAAEDEGMS